MARSRSTTTKPNMKLRQHKTLLQTVTALLLPLICLTSCNSTARMDFADKALVTQSVSKLANGGVRVSMEGDSLRNPTAAIERFHQIAAKQMGGTPYTYDYQVGMADVIKSKYRTEKHQMLATSSSTTTTDNQRGRSSGYGTIQLYNLGSGPAPNLGGGEIAAIVATVVVIALITNHLAKKKNEPVTTTQTDTVGTITVDRQVREEKVVGQVLQLVGTTNPAPKLNWSKTTPVEVIIPTTTPVIGKMTATQAQSFAESAAQSLRLAGLTASVVANPSGKVPNVKLNVLRAQGTMDSGNNQLTVEYELNSPGNKAPSARLFTQIATCMPPPLAYATKADLMGFGYSTAHLIKPLAKQLQAAL
jgi:hypothetical protein